MRQLMTMLFVAALLWSSGVEAQDFSYEGRLTDPEGKPFAGPIAMSLAFYHTAAGGVPVLTVTTGLAEVPLQEGLFQIKASLSPTDYSAVFSDVSQAVYVQITDLTHASDKPFPRQQIATAPYAARIPIDATTFSFNGQGQLALATGANASPGQFLTQDGSGHLSWATPVASATALQGQPLSSTATPAAGQVLKYDGSQWVPSNVTGATGGTVTSVTGSAPLVVTNQTSAPQISITQASGVSDGYLTSGDYLSFKGAATALTGGTTAQYLRGDKTWQTLGSLATKSTVTHSDITAGTIVDADISASAAIGRSKLASGSNNHVIINTGGGVLSSEAQLAPSRGGTGADLSATGGAGKYLKQTSVGGAVSVAAIAAADVPTFVASGASHAVGAVPDPGVSAGSTKFLREDASWAVPAATVDWTVPGTIGSATPNTGAFTTMTTTGAVGINKTGPGSQLVIKGVGATSATSSLNVTDSGDISKLFVRDDGNVGIGTTTPGGVLHTHTGDTTNYTIIDGGATAAQLVQIELADRGNSKWGLRKPSDNSFDIFEFASGNPSRLHFSAGGYAGIGTTTPTAGLEIDAAAVTALTGSVTATSGSASVTGSGTAFNTELSVGDSIKIGSGSYTISAIGSATTLTLSTNSTVSWPGLPAYKNGNLLTVATAAGASKMVVDKSGNVGIGTPSPGQKLSVAGTVESTSGGFKFPDATTMTSANFYKMPAMTSPNSGSFTWFNQGTATLDTAQGGMYIYAPAVAGDNFRILDKAIPAAPYTVTFGFVPNLHNVNYNLAGICMRESSSGKFVAFWVGGSVMSADKYTNVTTYSVNYARNTHTTFSISWLRVRDDGTNRIFEFSMDGVHWLNFSTAPRTDFLTPDNIGPCVESNHGTFDAGMWLLHYSEA